MNQQKPLEVTPAAKARTGAVPSNGHRPRAAKRTPAAKPKHIVHAIHSPARRETRAREVRMGAKSRLPVTMFVRPWQARRKRMRGTRYLGTTIAPFVVFTNPLVPAMAANVFTVPPTCTSSPVVVMLGTWPES